MSKLSYEDKVKIYQLRKQGETAINLSKKYNIRRENVNYMVRIIDKHGLDVLRKNANKTYTKLEKETAVIRVINGESMCSVAVDIGLTSYSPLRNIEKLKEQFFKDKTLPSIVYIPHSLFPDITQLSKLTFEA